MIHVTGMHGMGDNLHERAIVRELMLRDVVQLETPWPSLFHDLIGPRLRLVNKPSSLRTQAKNAKREAAKYQTARAITRPPLKIWYKPDAVRRLGSVLAAMCEGAGCDFGRADFRLPIPAKWEPRVDALLAKWQPAKPLLFYRPLVERTEWSGCKARNPDHAAYSRLLRSIRDRYFVVSVADIVPKVEWLVGDNIEADVELHSGELAVESLAALAHRSALVFSAPGFAVPLAQAVGTPVVCVFGGYENSSSFSAGARFSRYLGIDPMKPCSCWSHSHACDKRINVAAAIVKLRAFAQPPAMKP